MINPCETCGPSCDLVGDVADKIDELVPDANIPIEAHYRICREIIARVREHDRC